MLLQKLNFVIYLFILFTRVVILVIPNTPGPLSFIYLFFFIVIDMIDNMSMHLTCYT